TRSPGRLSERLRTQIRHKDHDLRVTRQVGAAGPRPLRVLPVITLYDYELSGNCYKLRLLMNMLGVSYNTVPIDFYPGREHKSEWFLKINPLGQLPVIEDDGLVLRDAQAILAYLASKYDPSGTWYPS